MAVKQLYDQLLQLQADKFYSIEAQFCTELYYGIPADKRPVCVTVFLTIANWSATSMQSGVWTFYEACPPDEVRVTLEYLQQSDTEELARMFALGIFAAIYFRQPAGYVLAVAAAGAFAYFFIKGNQ